MGVMGVMGGDGSGQCQTDPVRLIGATEGKGLNRRPAGANRARCQSCTVLRSGERRDAAVDAHSMAPSPPHAHPVKWDDGTNQAPSRRVGLATATPPGVDLSGLHQMRCSISDQP